MLNVGTRIGKSKPTRVVKKEVKRIGRTDWKQINKYRSGELFHTTEDRDFINLCVSFVNPCIFTGIQKVKAGLFYKSNSVVVITTVYVLFIMPNSAPERLMLVVVVPIIWFVPSSVPSKKILH